MIVAEEVRIAPHGELGRCAYCHDTSIPLEDRRACALCLALHHGECWRAACASCGCAIEMGATRARPSDDPLAQQRDALLGVVVSLVLVPGAAFLVALWSSDRPQVAVCVANLMVGLCAPIVMGLGLLWLLLRPSTPFERGAP